MQRSEYNKLQYTVSNEFKYSKAIKAFLKFGGISTAVLKPSTGRMSFSPAVLKPSTAKRAFLLLYLLSTGRMSSLKC